MSARGSANCTTILRMNIFFYGSAGKQSTRLLFVQVQQNRQNQGIKRKRTIRNQGVWETGKQHECERQTLIRKCFAGKSAKHFLNQDVNEKNAAPALYEKTPAFDNTRLQRFFNSKTSLSVKRKLQIHWFRRYICPLFAVAFTSSHTAPAGRDL